MIYVAVYVAAAIAVSLVLYGVLGLQPSHAWGEYDARQWTTVVAGTVPWLVLAVFRTLVAREK